MSAVDCKNCYCILFLKLINYYHRQSLLLFSVCNQYSQPTNVNIESEF